MRAFTAASGPKLPDTFDVQTATALDYFWLMFHPDLFNDMTRHTNNYARWKMVQTDKVDDYWTETTPAELRAYVGMNILMGVNSLPTANMYWSKDTYIGNVGISGIMTCNRYQKINQYFHVSDRETEPARGHARYDRLYKVRPTLDHVSETFLTNYDLGREVSIDEAMVRYSGRLSFKQYMPAKPIKRGMKIWMCCDAKNAYLSRFSVYLGKRDNGPEQGLGHNVVTTLTDNIQGTYRWIYFDNFFTGVPLLEDLLESGLYGCGTVRVNRKGFPVDLKKPRNVKERGQFLVMQKGATNLTASVWKDKRLVHHLSTLSDPTVIRDCQRKNGRAILELRQPSSCHSYNQYMAGVDKHDQLRMKYEVGRNSKKWWRYLFWFVVNCAIVNAYIIYKATSSRVLKKKRYSHLDFRVELARDMVAGFASRKRKISEVVNVGLVQVENINGHVNSRMPGPKGRCRYHRVQLNTRRETVYGCQVCGIHLCKDCHGRFHNL